MKKIYFTIIIFFVVLGVSCQSTKKIISTKIFEKQNTLGKGFAKSAKWARDEIFKKYSKHLFPSDTLFLIERVEEPGLTVWGFVWTTKRDLVYEYLRGYQTTKDSIINYSNWEETFKNNVEQFDTASIPKIHVFGGNRVFITQVIRGKEIKTFYFSEGFDNNYLLKNKVFFKK